MGLLRVLVVPTLLSQPHAWDSSGIGELHAVFFFSSIGERLTTCRLFIGEEKTVHRGMFPVVFS